MYSMLHTGDSHRRPAISAIFDCSPLSTTVGAILPTFRRIVS